MGQRKRIEKLIFIALLVALSVVLGIIDTYISNVVAVQGVRIGLANIVILTGIYYLNFKESLLLVILKSLLTFVITARIITFAVGLSGTLLSFLVMFILLKTAKDKLSLMGISVSGGIAHNIGQVLVLIILYGLSISFTLFYLIPIGFGTGIFVGAMVSVLRKYLDNANVFKTITHNNTDFDFSLLEEE